MFLCSFLYWGKVFIRVEIFWPKKNGWTTKKLDFSFIIFHVKICLPKKIIAFTLWRPGLSRPLSFFLLILVVAWKMNCLNPETFFHFDKLSNKSIQWRRLYISIFFLPSALRVHIKKRNKEKRCISRFL